MKFDLFHPDILTNPNALYARLHEHGSVHRGGPPMPEFPECWYVSGYSEALQVLKNPAFVHDRGKVSGLPPLSDFSGEALLFWRQVAEWPLFIDAPQHDTKRQLLGSFFRENAVLGLEQFITQKSYSLLDQVLVKSESDIMWDFTYPLSLSVICRLIGIQTPELRWFKSCTSRLADTLDLRTGLHDYKPSLHALAELNAFFTDQLKQPIIKNSLLGNILGKGISHEELSPILLQLIFAGQETASDAIGNSLVALAGHPEARRQLSAKPELMESAVCEILRYDNPVQFSGIRTATEPVKLGGKIIDRGNNIVIAIGACNHDPRYFDNPQEFNIARKTSGPEISFGHGIHHCLGIHLARLEIRIALQTLLNKLPANWGIELLEMRENRVFRGPASLTLTL